MPRCHLGLKQKWHGGLRKSSLGRNSQSEAHLNCTGVKSRVTLSQLWHFNSSTRLIQPSEWIALRRFGLLINRLTWNLMSYDVLLPVHGSSWSANDTATARRVQAWRRLAEVHNEFVCWHFHHNQSPAFRENIPKKRKDPVSGFCVEEEYGFEVKVQNGETGWRTLKKATAPQISYLFPSLSAK